MIFISYSRKNMEAARAVRSVLQANGLSVWMDENSIVVGTDYADRIPAAIEACTAFVLVLSQESMMSAWVRKELDTALLMEKPILPIHIDKSNISRAYTFMLSGIQFVEASGNSADAYKRLVSRAKALEAEAEGGAADAPAGPSQKKGLLDLLGFGAKKKPAAVPESAALKSQLKPVDYSKEIEALCQRVAELDAIYDGMSPSTFGSQTSRFRERLARGEVLESIMPEAIATMWHAYGRASTSTLNAAIALFKGMAVDVDAGDPLDVPIAFAAYAYALEGKGVHAVFETEEAARRACRYFARPFERLGISTAVVGRKDSSDDKRAAYAADVTFGSYATFVLDYLSDNTVGSPVRRVQRGLAIALINHLFLGRFYESRKVKEIEKAYKTINSLDSLAEEDFNNAIMEIAIQDNLQILITDEDFTTVRSTSRDAKELAARLFGYYTGFYRDKTYRIAEYGSESASERNKQKSHSKSAISRTSLSVFAQPRHGSVIDLP